MSLKKTIIPITLCVLALSAGYAARKLTSPPDPREEQLLVQAGESQRENHSPTESAPANYIPPEIKSTDTVETLIEKGENATFNELAIWFQTASPEDMTTYWAACSEIKPHQFYTSLVFMNWGRIDPMGAVNATAGTKHEGMSWWGWAVNDPEAALAAVPPKFLKRAYNSIGQFQTQWVRDHFDEIPEDMQKMVLDTQTTWKEDSDLAARLDFLKEHGRGVHGTTLKTLARKDPWAAYDWLQKENELKIDQWRDGPAEILINTMGEEHPEDLERLAEMTPSGQLKWKMEDVIFQKLLASDQDAAFDYARKIESPLIASKRLAKIGSELLQSDPQKAFDLASEILSRTPNNLSPDTVIEVDGHSVGSGSRDTGTREFIHTLAAKDPERIMEMVAIASEPNSDTFQGIARDWVGRDLDSFSSWVTQQKDPQIYNAGANNVVTHLSQSGRFEEASEWALSSYDRNSPGSLYNLLFNWGKVEPQKAAQWLENSEIDETTRTRLKQFINRN